MATVRFLLCCGMFTSLPPYCWITPKKLYHAILFSIDYEKTWHCSYREVSQTQAATPMSSLSSAFLNYDRLPLVPLGSCVNYINNTFRFRAFFSQKKNKKEMELVWYIHDTHTYILVGQRYDVISQTTYVVCVNFIHEWVTGSIVLMDFWESFYFIYIELLPEICWEFGEEIFFHNSFC